MRTIASQAVADAWADGDEVGVLVEADGAWWLGVATFDSAENWLLLADGEDTSGSIADGAAAIVSATLTDAVVARVQERTTFATAQALRDFRPPGGRFPKAVRTLGALAANDGGGALWRWDAASEEEDAVHIAPTGHTGAGRWVLAANGHVDVRCAGMTTTVADAGANWQALVALCTLLSAQGGGVVEVPPVGAAFPVSGGVPPQYLDHMTFRGGGELRQFRLVGRDELAEARGSRAVEQRLENDADILSGRHGREPS
jgi:hypothetical protein